MWVVPGSNPDLVNRPIAAVFRMVIPRTRSGTNTIVYTRIACSGADNITAGSENFPSSRALLKKRMSLKNSEEGRRCKEKFEIFFQV